METYLQSVTFESQKVFHDCKTETHMSPTLTCKEENDSLMEIKEEE